MLISTGPNSNNTHPGFRIQVVEVLIKIHKRVRMGNPDFILVWVE